MKNQRLQQLKAQSENLKMETDDNISNFHSSCWLYPMSVFPLERKFLRARMILRSLPEYFDYKVAAIE